MWYVVDLIGGPEDGKEYSFPDLPPFLFFPYIPEPATMLAYTDDHTTLYNAPKLVYRHITNGLYWFQGIQD